MNAQGTTVRQHSGETINMDKDVLCIKHLALYREKFKMLKPELELRTGGVALQHATKTMTIGKLVWSLVPLVMPSSRHPLHHAETRSCAINSRIFGFF